MKDKDFRTMRALSTDRRFKMCDEKSVEYTRGNGDDRTCNFKRMGEMLGLSAKVVWTIYFEKHHDALIEYIKTGKQGTEGIRSRMDDMRNYLDLLEGLITDEEEEREQKEAPLFDLGTLDRPWEGTLGTSKPKPFQSIHDGKHEIRERINRPDSVCPACHGRGFGSDKEPACPRCDGSGTVALSPSDLPAVTEEILRQARESMAFDPERSDPS